MPPRFLPIIKSVFFASAALFLLGTPLLAADAALYQNDFSKTEPGKLPDDFLVTSGEFQVVDDAGNKVLELPGAPLESFGLLFGPSDKPPLSVGGRFFGTKTGRKFPVFAISLGGVAGYRLQVSPAKKAIEIYRGDESKISVPFDWVSGAWVHLRLSIVPKQGGGWHVHGKVWAADAQEPAAPTVTFEPQEDPPAGRAGIWGSPYSGTPIRYDDLRLEKTP